MLLVDMAHIAGLVAAGVHPNPVPHAHFVTTTTHKTLRGSRGGMILCKQEFADAVDQQVFPGLQGGPMMHAVAAKAVTLHEALKPEFKEYGKQIVQNAKALSGVFLKEGFRLVSGGTDNHLMLIDLSDLALTGHNAAVALERAGIILNKNPIPFDKTNPLVTSGIRLGTPMVTTLGMKEPEMEVIAGLITQTLRHINDESTLKRVRTQVEELAVKFPVP
jgi:glycine hydroxymethyltransferase